MTLEITELVVEAYGCTGPLNDGELICRALRESALAVGATIVREATHAYCPHGVTAMIFLAESHVMLTTWPEHGYAVAEIFLCNPSMDPMACWRVIEQLVQPAQTRFHRVPLRVGPS